MSRALLIALAACGTPTPSDEPPHTDPPASVDSEPPPVEPSARPAPAWVGMRRLAVPELRRTLDDLFEIAIGDGLVFPEETTAWSFDHLSGSQPASDVLIEQLDAAAVASSQAWLAKVRGAEVASAPVWTLGDPYGCAQQDVNDDERFWWVSWVDQPVSWSVMVPSDGVWLLSLDVFHRVALQGGDSLELAIEVDGAQVWSQRMQGPYEPSVLELPLTLTAGRHTVALRLLDGMTVERDAAYTGDTSFCVTAEALAYRDLRLIGPRDTGPTGQPCHPSLDPTCTASTLRTWLTRVWRRPPSAGELDRATALFELALAEQATFDEAVSIVLRALLLSPNFLYRPEFSGGSPTRAEPVDHHSLATRLSYTLWGSTPDDELLACAAAGALHTPEGPCGLDAQLDRLLASPRAAGFVERFVGQWLGIHDLPDRTSPDGAYLPVIGPDMQEETYAVFQEHLDRPDLPANDLLAAPFTWLTPPLAAHYGVPFGGNTGHYRVSWGPGERLGLLGHASILTATSTSERTSPMRRAAWVLERLLCESVGAPPPGIPELDHDAPVEEAFAAHAANPACAGCHDRLDPIGLTLETFDEAGRLRPGHQAEPRTLPSGEVVHGPAELTRWLTQSEGWRQCLVASLATYALGRRVDPSEARRIEDWRSTAGGEAAPWRALVEAVLTSPSFTHRVAAPDVQASDVEVGP